LREFPTQRFDTEWGPISCRTAGNGPDLVLLHGIGSGSGSWAHQFGALAGSFRITAWDMPGYGDSQRIDAPTCGAYANALAALLTARAVRLTVLVGHSLGALIAAHFARHWPERVRGLILADPARGHAVLPAGQRREKRDTRLQRFTELGPAEHARTRAAALLSDDADEEQRALVRFNMQRLDRDGYADATQLLSDGDLLDDVAHIEVPARVLCGSADAITPPEGAQKVAATFPRKCGYREIAGAGHASYIEAPETFNRLLCEFVEALP